MAGNGALLFNVVNAAVIASRDFRTHCRPEDLHGRGIFQKWSVRVAWRPCSYQSNVVHGSESRDGVAVYDNDHTDPAAWKNGISLVANEADALVKIGIQEDRTSIWKTVVRSSARSCSA